MSHKMLGKLLKRYHSRTSINDNTSETVDLDDSQNNGQKKEEKDAAKSSQESLPPQYHYQRPDLIGPYTMEEMTQFASHGFRPVVPGNPDHLPKGVGYAEAMNAGKSRYNEDQAACYRGQLVHDSGIIKYLYIGLFDGHGGPGAAVKAMNEMHQIIHEGLEDVLDHILKSEPGQEPRINTTLHHKTNGIEEVTEKLPADNAVEEVDEFENDLEDVKMTRDELVSGALESAFWAMDRLILRDKQQYRISGGACALVALFIFDKLYIANAGDCRACVYLSGKPQQILQMSHDFSPDADRQRIQMIAYQRPELLRHPHTKEKLFNRHILSRKVTEQDVGKSVLYKDFYMTGWSCRDVIPDDVILLPIIDGKGKQCRLMATMGVARGIGDHDLVVRTAAIRLKDFLTCQPEVRIFELKELDNHERGFLVMATDGYWDVISNEETRDFLDQSPTSMSENDLASQLVLEARGVKVPDLYWEKQNGDLASGDDITVILANMQKIRSCISSETNC